MDYLGYSIRRVIGGYVFDRPGVNTATAKTLTEAFREIKRRLEGEPRTTGQVLPEERDTNRIGRDWARGEMEKEREAEMNRLKAIFNLDEEKP